MAGVSVASASFALNGQPGVAEDTRKRILAVAAELGYRANTQARALRRGQTTTYGIVVRNFANPFFLDVLSGAEDGSVVEQNVNRPQLAFDGAECAAYRIRECDVSRERHCSAPCSGNFRGERFER